VALVVDDDPGLNHHADRPRGSKAEQMGGWISRCGSHNVLFTSGRFTRLVDFTAWDIHPLVVSSGIDTDSLHYKMEKYIFIAAIAYCLVADSGLSTQRWYSQEVIFADWRGIPAVDYSTNAPLSTWYSGHSTKYLRAENLERFLAEPDTVTVGIDYYGLSPASGNLASSFHSQLIIDSLLNGGVLVAKSIHGELTITGDAF
jgi:hypothetical protein